MFLFQLLCVLGDWERARDQLKALGELDAGSFPLVHLYGAAITCELLRREVFAGTRTPVMLGEPLPWVALLLQALAAEAQGRARRGQGAPGGGARAGARGARHHRRRGLRVDRRRGLAPRAGVRGGDRRPLLLGAVRAHPLRRARGARPICATSCGCRPISGSPTAARRRRCSRLGTPGSESDPDGLIRLGRKTEWDEVAPDTFHGRGQRMLATDSNEYALLNVRRIELGRARRREMVEVGARDTLQPALLDRLTDHDPTRKVESRRGARHQPHPAPRLRAARPDLALQHHEPRRPTST